MLEGCRMGKHDECKRESQKLFFDTKNKLVWLDEFNYCQCSKRGCKCFVKASERTKKKKRKS